MLDTQLNIHLMFKIANDLSGDLNTGIYFPSADTIAFTEGGTEAMRIDSSGRVGIGITAPGEKLVLIGNQLIAPGTDSLAGTPFIQIRSTGTGDGSPNSIKIGMDGVALSGVAYIDAISAGVASATPLTFRNNGTERMRITTDGDLLVQKTSIGTGNAGPNSFDALYSFDSQTTGNIASGGTGSVKYSQSGNAAGCALAIINAYNAAQGNENRAVVLLLSFRNPVYPGGTVINTISTAFADSGDNAAITSMTFAIDAANSELDITPTLRGGSGNIVVNVRFIAM